MFNVYGTHCDLKFTFGLCPYSDSGSADSSSGPATSSGISTGNGSAAGRPGNGRPTKSPIGCSWTLSCPLQSGNVCSAFVEEIPLQHYEMFLTVVRTIIQGDSGGRVPWLG